MTISDVEMQAMGVVMMVKHVSIHRPIGIAVSIMQVFYINVINIIIIIIINLLRPLQQHLILTNRIN